MALLSYLRLKNLWQHHDLYPLLERLADASAGLTKETRVELTPSEAQAMDEAFAGLEVIKPDTTLEYMFGQAMPEDGLEERDRFRHKTGLHIRLVVNGKRIVELIRAPSNTTIDTGGMRCRSI